MWQFGGLGQLWVLMWPLPALQEALVPPRVCVWVGVGPYWKSKGFRQKLQEQSSGFEEKILCPSRTPEGHCGAGGLRPVCKD